MKHSKARIWSGVTLAAVAAAAVFCLPARQQAAGSAAPPGQMQAGAAAYTGIDTIGGGPGYSRLVDIGKADFIAHDLASLRSALQMASAGQTVYLQDKADIDVTGEPSLIVPRGVTLASGRGRGGSSGALLRTSTDNATVLHVTSPNVRITGLRLQGPSPDVPKGDPPRLTSHGIHGESSGLEVDNCEIWAFTHGGVWLTSGSKGTVVHHCYIHHCRREALGYGVVLGESEALIEANRFAENRHDIAATGRPGTSYIARYNISECYDPPVGHAFDMHGNHESRPPGQKFEPFAGERLVIHNNTFRSAQPRNCITVRGRPRRQLVIHSNVYENPLVGVWLREPCNNAVIYNDVFRRQPQVAFYRFKSDGNTLNGRRRMAGDIVNPKEVTR